MSDLDTARAELRARQGRGARYDAPQAPGADLALVRLGTAHFARHLNALSDAALAGPSALAGLSRAWVVADVALHARAICWQVEDGDPGADAAQSADARDYLADVALSAALPPRALRHLFEHSAIHLNVVWRDLPGPGWDAPACDATGRACPMRDLPAERARRIWQAALDLGSGAQPHDLPPPFRPATGDATKEPPR